MSNNEWQKCPVQEKVRQLENVNKEVRVVRTSCRRCASVCKVAGRTDSLLLLMLRTRNRGSSHTDEGKLDS